MWDELFGVKLEHCTIFGASWQVVPNPPVHPPVCPLKHAMRKKGEDTLSITILQIFHIQPFPPVMPPKISIVEWEKLSENQ